MSDALSLCVIDERVGEGSINKQRTCDMSLESVKHRRGLESVHLVVSDRFRLSFQDFHFARQISRLNSQ